MISVVDDRASVWDRGHGNPASQIWLLQKTKEGDGFQDWHVDLQGGTKITLGAVCYQVL